jgi:transposase
MAKARTLVGLDVHAAKVVAAVLDAETGELRVQRLGGESESVVGLCRLLEGPVRVSYEAGPTGFGLARMLTAAGIDCLVAHLVRLLLAGKLEPVRVPSSEEEALRDLVRAREDVRGDLMRARHRVSKMLLRHDRRFTGGQQAWSGRHRDWLQRLELDDPVAQLDLAPAGGGARQAAHARRGRRRARAGRLLLGSRPSLSEGREHVVEEAAVAWPSRDGHPRFSYEQPVAGRRSFLCADP